MDRVAHTDSGQVRTGVGVFPVVLQGKLILIGETKIYTTQNVHGMCNKPPAVLGD